ncbi:uncharacterized protein LOC108913215 [Anoplophora glabripennis]|uniref:uncharacterized protein LOC108913215 n=1 Tax=Anoplophora glabripennis TaxID=217634 RepID=UPI000873E96F|nr:uncharacterized protein LOC108913215 [Anoplophora glabripennis]
MKVEFTTVLVLAILSIAAGLPATSPRDIKDEVEIVPLEHNPYGDQPIVDTGIIGYGPFSNPFSGLLENLEGIMTRMRQQMDALLKRFPAIRGNSTEDIPDFPIGVGLPAFGDIDLSKGNTTSVTKVIDGHKVVINETEYKKEDDFGGAFFKVRIIDVRPDSSELTTNGDTEVVTTPPSVPDRESIENSIENEIIKSKEARDTDNIETFDEVDNRPFQKFKYSTNLGPEWNDVESIETFEDNSITPHQYPPRPIDLSDDIRVNQILADSGAPINPDAEFIYDIREPQNLRQTDRFLNPR